MLAVVAAVILLGLSVSKTSTFNKDLVLMKDAKFASIKFKNLQILTRALILRGNNETAEIMINSPTDNALVNNTWFLQN